MKGAKNLAAAHLRSTKPNGNFSQPCMSFISSITDVDTSKSTCPEALSTPSGSGLSARKRRSNSRDDDTTNIKKADFYQSCIEALKPTKALIGF